MGLWTHTLQDTLHRQIANARMFLEVFATLEFVLQGTSKVTHVLGGCGL